jgi:predicted transglutaminase-like cysteine proteinase
MIGGMLSLTLAPTADAAKFSTLASNKNANKNGLFASTEIRGDSFKTLPKWSRVLKKMAKQKAELAACSNGAATCPPGAAKAWGQIIKEAKGLSKKKQLVAVNKYFNRWPYKLDQAVYKVSDYWATPFEFLKLSGDCEDYAIAKFYALKQLGWANDDLRIVALVDRIRGVAHAVLAVNLGEKTLILDNVSNIVTSHLLYKHYIPHYSVNETTKWSHIKVTKKRK